MSQTTAPRIAKLPFIFGDLLLVAGAAWIAWYGGSLGPWQYAAMIGALALGAWLGAWPFVLEFRAASQMAETSELTSVTEKIRDLDKVSTSLAKATSEWLHLQQATTQTVTSAEHIAEQMTAEARNFGEILSRQNDVEKNHLRLEVDKLRRAEGDWLAVTVRILDHVHAVHAAAVRSGQRNVVDQQAHFQNACRDTARRIGLMPLLPEPGIPFDAAAHQLLDGSKPAEGSIIDHIVAPGFTFQGKLIRLPVVALRETKPVETAAPEAQLAFDQPAS